MAAVSCRLTGEGLARALELGGVPRREPCPQRYRWYLEKDATQMPATARIVARLTRAVQPRAHLRELELDGLEGGDGGAEGLALLRVGHRNLEGRLPLRTTSRVVSG